MAISRPVKKPVIALLIKRGTFFFGGICILAVFLYALGSFQEFMDTTQLLLLRIAVFFGFFFAAFALYGFVHELWMILYRRRFRFIAGAGVYVFLVVLGAVIAAVAAFIMVLARGNMVI